MSSREEFEALCAEHLEGERYAFLRAPDGRYILSHVQFAWSVWTARDARIAELERRAILRRDALRGVLDPFHQGQVSIRPEADGYVHAAIQAGEDALNLAEEDCQETVAEIRALRARIAELERALAEAGGRINALAAIMIDDMIEKATKP